jgi:ribosomal protein S18 acetylase RimI-like enzyme
MEFLMKDPTFRSAELSDRDILLSLIRQYYAFDHIEADTDALRPSLETLISDPTLGRIWLIQADNHNQPVGYVILTFGYDLEFGGRQATVTDLYIVPEYRGYGFGFKTLQFIEESCRTLGIRAFELQVKRENLAAQRLYERFGMMAHDRIPMSKWVSL